MRRRNDPLRQTSKNEISRCTLSKSNQADIRRGKKRKLMAKKNFVPQINNPGLMFWKKCNLPSLEYG